MTLIHRLYHIKAIQHSMMNTITMNCITYQKN